MHTRKLISTVLLVSVFLTPSIRAAEPDALDDALAAVGLQRADLGWRPKGWWPKFPADIPYKLRAFDALFAQPLDTITYTRLLGETARKHLDPSVMNARLERGDTNLYHAVHILGINPKFGGMRGYACNLEQTTVPLDEAILRLYHAAERTTHPMTFQMELPYPKIREGLAERIQVIPEDVRPIVGRLIVNIIDAERWMKLAFRNVDGNDRMVVARRFDLGHEEVDAYDYCPAFDDVEKTIDHASLWYAAEKSVQALDDARVALLALEDIKNSPDFAFDWRTPWGWIRIHGSGNDKIDGTDALLIVDLGGNDVYTGGVAASTAERPIGLLLDLAGNDRYESNEPAQGAGICGVGVLIDSAGNDVYRAENHAQGVGQFGLGVCADMGGDDDYFVKFSGQGCGYFGVGLMFDCDGNDAYRLYADGQGLGGVTGVGVLADRKGNDTYEAVRSAKITGRPSYHSPDHDVSVSNAQGCAMGRRGDGSDGHSWAGGLGALIDIEGHDRYTSGNWTMGTGYWFGIGLLYEGDGNDEYHGVCYSQATGAHFCIGVLLDEGGNDKHLGEETSNMCIGWGHDFVISLHVDIGGNDLYDVKNDGISYNINRSVTAVIDIGGDDTYRSHADHHPGMAICDEERFIAGDATRPLPNFYFADVTSAAIFLDIGGNDDYWSGNENNSTWTDEPDSPNVRVRNRSIGVDRAEGEVRFVPLPEKTPKPMSLR